MAKYEVTIYEVVGIKILVDAESEQDAIIQAIDINNDGEYPDGTPVPDGVYHRTSDDITVIKL
jgi:hypothetical protein